MSGAAEAIDLLERAVRQSAQVIGAIGVDAHHLPTPCPEWDVQALVRHVIGQDLRNFAAAACGGTPDWLAPPRALGPDWVAQFDAGAAEVLANWRAADLDREVVMPSGAAASLGSRVDQQIAELTVHSWDLARATGQRAELDPALAERSLAWARPMLRPQFRGPDMAFGDEVPVPETAPVYDRLAGWFGRDPQWAGESAGG
ncbi:TIGR03086 family protein [Rhodococcus sp. D2-41]|uniref:TIGR03086 family metal-binding protein n=1 Tax=Speluncibacter jeojiensis TaxID=2710754 RepID=A0A9X4M260_9ACTN|nr:TIGR03086 family metal-binding protein [Rhodococcus sp. D2-41]MDG3011340.1 TIGR03086 family protein [Rhodococcus sp. D2-41]MDG3016648.1 TIGR03086 family metal-binding protein [Corynebacteriales bacterium D3-21]